MTDSLGWRKKFSVIIPSTNTSVQPEFDAMRPVGITNHISRIHIPDDPVNNDDDFNALMNNIRKGMMVAIDGAMSCRPDYLVLGMSAETFWDGLDASKVFMREIEERSGLKVAMGSDSCQAALRSYNPALRRIAVITPYMPVGDINVVRFFTECGFDVLRIKGLKCKSPMMIAHVDEVKLRDAIMEVDGPDVEAIIQVGTNLAMARVAAIAEFWLNKPVIAINTATYWWALRQNGINDRVQGFGKLLSDF